MMSAPIKSPDSSKIFRVAIWIAIGALIAAALVCVVWVLIGEGSGVVGRAFLTILLLVGFAGIALLESSLAPKRPTWLTITSMVTWVVALLIGALLIWLPYGQHGSGYGVGRFFSFLVIVLVLQGALLHVVLYSKAYARYQTTFTSVVAYVTIGLLGILAVMLIIPLVTAEFWDFLPIYWRIVTALAILVAVGTILLPLVNALFAPKKPRPQPAPYGPAGANPAYTQPIDPHTHAQQGYAQYPQGYGSPQYAPQQQAWPTYADGRTPLPVMPDGTPDWNAYYTGWPSQPGYSGAPPMPPAPPQP